MTTITSTLAISPIGGYVNPHVTSALRSVDPAWIGWPTNQADIGTAPAAAMTRVTAAAHPRTINGTLAHSYADDYYDRIHITPLRITLGALVTRQTRTVDVWNAYRARTLTLSQVNESNASGIDLNAPGALPLAFPPLKDTQWTINITTVGSSSIAADVSWLFAGFDPIPVHITGERVTAWMVSPDWSTHGITETLEWLTDVQQSVSGQQLRVVDRETPRRSWEFDIATGGTERQLMESALHAVRGRTWALPMWVDQSFLAAPLESGSTSVPLTTAGLDFEAGKLAMLRRSASDYELVQIDLVENDALTFANATINRWPAGTALYPCRLARITDTPSLTRASSDVITSTLRFQSAEPCPWDATPPAATYRGIPVLEARTNEASAPTAGPDRQLQILDGDVGAQQVDDVTGLPWSTQSHAWWLAGRAARAAQRSQLYWMAGRANALWLPSWADDVTLTETIGAGSTVMKVARCGITQYAAGTPGRQHLRFERADGSVEYRAVTAASVLDTDTEELTLDTPLTAALDPAGVRQISWMMLATLGSDSVEIDHLTDSEGLATCDATFVAVPAEEPAP